MTSVHNDNEHPERSLQEQTKDEIEDLERRLAEAKARLVSHTKPACHTQEEIKERQPNGSPAGPAFNSTHFLFLLADSALPLGSFAFSSGLESYLAHSRGGMLAPSPSSPSSSQFMPASAFAADFLPLSLSSYASATLPFVLAAHRDPDTTNLAALDDVLDATIVCTVGRRPSVAQGRALLSIWERSLAPAIARADLASAGALRPFSALLKAGSSSSAAPTSSNRDALAVAAADLPPVAAHLPPLFGAVANLLGLTEQQTAYVFLLGHVKALVSAAVRAGLFGPYQAQRLLAGAEVQRQIAAAVEREWATPVERAGQSVPVMDLWIGRHEVLYSRIFNS